MSKNSWLRRRWKLVLNLVTLAALAILIYALRDQIADTFSNLGKVNAWLLLLIIPIEILNYHAQARMYQGLFKMVGNKLSYKSLYKMSLELNFVNHVFPSGGVTGISYFSLRLRDGEKLTGSKATLVHIVKLGLTFLSFEILIIFGLLSLAVMGHANNLTILVAGSLSTLLLVGTGVFVYIVGSQSRINSFFVTLTKWLNKLIQIVRPRHPETINIGYAKQVFEDFHDNYKTIQSSYKQLKGPFWWALVANITEVAVIYVVYMAFDQYVNLGAVILAYGVANFAGMISVLPGGIGIYEALMTAVLVSAGVPAAVSLPVTVMYRVLNTVIQLPPGYYLYHKALKGGQPPARQKGLPMAAEPADLELGVSDFVALLNQTLEYAYPNVVITGELANLRVSKNRWVYFDLKDELATVKFFGTVYQLPGPLEDGLMLKVRGQPRLHPLYGFSVNVMSIQPAGEGAIKRAADLLKAKLSKEGLFDDSRKRGLPYPPRRIGLVTSKQSAAYADFIKVLDARWRGLDIDLIDVQVQGEPAPGQITAALEQLNAQAEPPDAIVIIRGGGSAEDLAAFSNEQVTRAVAASRVPTLVAIGHEIDLSLAELAADRRASTPSNAAELLVPDRQQALAGLTATAERLHHDGHRHVRAAQAGLGQQAVSLSQGLAQTLNQAAAILKGHHQTLEALNPKAILRRGYAVVRQAGRPLRTTKGLKPGVIVDVKLNDGGFAAAVKEVKGRS